MIFVQNPVQVADYSPGSVYGPRLLPNFELVWLLRGSAQLCTEILDADGQHRGTESQLLRPGTVALSRQGNRDCYRWDTAGPSRHAYVHFELLDAGHLGTPASWPSVRTLADAPVLEGLCDYLLELAGQPSAQSKRRSDQIVQLVLDLFVSGPHRSDREEVPAPVGRMSEYVARLWATDGQRQVPVSDLAASAHVSIGYLHRTFKHAYGCGPSRALELIRLSQAATALQRSNDTISEIAARSGFCNPYHFSRRFHQTYGAPPKAFRCRQPLTDPLWPVRDAQLLAVARMLLRASDEL
ncbi:AraC-type DNA-binding protein [Microlunatus soli]|uniref:AraC-type DNA-binding protein n=2 Tax=Microlunatus soli TaxID=630515 RepID=A0A1H1YL66_9ACTN|nr:AraC-type DNA-binding protein [Microlunatus soli]